MRKKRTLAALLACAMLLGGTAAADWADDIADELAARLIALASDEGYVSLFTSSEGVLEQTRRMALNAEQEARTRSRYLMRENPAEVLRAYAASQGSELPELSDLAMEALAGRLSGTAAMLLNGQAGVEWLTACSLLTDGATYLLPEGFAPCAVLLDYGTDADILITFAQTGEDTMSASAVFVDAGSVESGAATLDLFYTRP